MRNPPNLPTLSDPYHATRPDNTIIFIKNVTIERLKKPPAAGAVDLSAGVKIKHTKNDASGGEVSHLESAWPLRFAPRSSGQITALFLRNSYIYFLTDP